MFRDHNTPCSTAVDTQPYDRILLNNIEVSYPLTLKTTFDCGVQTNLDGRINPQADISGLDEIMIKKRQKRKQYKKRKKMQKKIMQKENKEEFKQIIDLFYQRQAKFVDYSDRLEQLVCSFNQADFKDIFDAILKERVVIIQNSIWEYTQAILQENPLEMRHDHPFYLQMVDQIYKYYKLIEKSSFEAEQVIYIYLSLNSKQTDQPITPQDLGRRTFRYLVQTDETLRKLIHMCDKKITFVRVNERQKLEIMISKLKNFRERFDNNLIDSEENDDGYFEQGDQQNGQEDDQDEQEDDQSERHQFEDQKSTAISENSEEFQDQEKSAAKKKRKKRLVNLNLEEEQEKLYNYLQNFTLQKDTRLECNIEDDLSSKLLSKVDSMRRSFKKHTQFDLLTKKLESLEPFRHISKEFQRTY